MLVMATCMQCGNASYGHMYAVWSMLVMTTCTQCGNASYGYMYAVFVSGHSFLTLTLTACGQGYSQT